MISNKIISEKRFATAVKRISKTKGITISEHEEIETKPTEKKRKIKKQKSQANSNTEIEENIDINPEKKTKKTKAKIEKKKATTKGTKKSKKVESVNIKDDSELNEIINSENILITKNYEEPMTLDEAE